ncbi:CCHC-type domain-containing protein [Trichonephila clavata]|uniref:CCHC-type domain-containing protein n=1 Tax=Trichonephila clavata TaxID=2740835 RepID=A0A8X6FFP9_TRICU|nr:CCHC-type domain-containing protein [Trichonephila clavata]
MDLAERKRKEEIDLAERKRKDIEFAERKRKQEMEMAERKRLDKLEERNRKDEMDFELQKKRIECYTCGKEVHFSRACRDKNLNKQDSQKNKFSSPINAQSNAVQAEDTTKNIVTAKIDASESTCNFLAENIDKLKAIKVKCLDVVLDGTVDSGAQISVVRADLVKDIECTGEEKIKLISAFGNSEVASLRTFNIKIDDGWHDAIPITCAVSKKLVNDMLVCQTAYEALLESIQLCSVNARQAIGVGVQMEEVKDSTVCEVLTREESSYSDLEVSTDAVNIENEVRSNLSSETRRPAKVVKLSRPHSCLVRMEDGNTRELHVIKPKPYISRVDHVGIIFDQGTDFGELHYAPTDKENQPNIDIELNQMPDILNAQQKYQLRNLLQRYKDIFWNRPGKVRVKGHSVKVTADSSPKRLQPYRVPIALQKEVVRQINELLDMDLIEHSDSVIGRIRWCVRRKKMEVLDCA